MSFDTPISVIRLGFEPKTHSLEGCCSIQLSYQTISFEIACRLPLRSAGLRLPTFMTLTSDGLHLQS